MDKEQPKKCFCARCFQPIDEEDKVEVGGQNFHRCCSACCVCHSIPTSIKMFYGHVFCNECFKMHVLGRFKGEPPRMQSNSWWTQWAPGVKPQDVPNEKDVPKNCENQSEEPCRKCICSRCLQAVDENEKVDIGGQHFHPQCAKCYFCQTVPKSNLKIYYGQVFCEDCFNRHVLNRNRDNPSEFFKTCFEQWQNVQFVEGMRQFMGVNNNKDGPSAPFVFCRCAGQTEWGPQPDTRKSATPGENASFLEDDSLEEDLYFENRSENMSEIPEYCIPTDDVLEVQAAEKIEKLTQYLHETPSQLKTGKKWKNFVESDKISLTSCGWVDLQDGKVKSGFECPKCLWQCGPIVVQSELLQRQVCCGNALK